MYSIDWLCLLTNDSLIANIAYPAIAFKKIAKIVDLQVIFSSREKQMSLSDAMFRVSPGKHLNKMYQCRDWNSDLDIRQMEYAALDAHCLLALFSYCKDQVDKSIAAEIFQDDQVRQDLEQLYESYQR